MPIYSYKKFKELADDRMSLVKIFVQRNDTWQPAGKGTIKYYQLIDSATLKEIKSTSDINRLSGNFFLLIDGSDVEDITEEELENLRSYRTLLKMRDFKSDNIFVFYDIMFGTDFDFDIERELNRPRDIVDPHPRRTAANRDQLRVRRGLQ
jgi:hypothetical protein